MELRTTRESQMDNPTGKIIQIRILLCLIIVMVIGCKSDTRSDDENATLTITTGDVLSYYPFGQTSKLDTLMLNCSMDSISRKMIPLYDNSEDEIEIIRLSKASSFMDFCLIETFRDSLVFYEVLSGEIADTEIKLLNGLTIGSDKNIVAEKLNLSEHKLSKISRIIVTSEVEGIWYEYIFTDQKLSRILFRTDYTISW